MSVRRKLVYSFIVIASLCLLVEGTAQFVWWRLEARALHYTRYQGEQILRNDAINFMKEPDDVLGYSLKPGDYGHGLWINEQRFPQREVIPVERKSGYLRVVCLGESTTMGNNSLSSYPGFLQQILDRDGLGFDGYEVINGGVPGWVSDQIALRVKYQIAKFKPDVVIMYVGWNDFQSYDPLASPPQISYFESYYTAGSRMQYATSRLKSVALLSALYRSRFSPGPAGGTASPGTNSPEQNYRFLMRNLARIVDDVRAANPAVRILVSTLVGRWPQGTPEEWAKIPPVWWMTQHQLTPQTVVPFVNRLNDQLRNFARTRGLGLIDMAEAFQELDRAKLQSDWAHMTSEGYELMAWNMFSSMQRAGIIQAKEDPRFERLLAQYRLNASAAMKH